ncbi:MAG: type II toxin-antitoxin system prevent-host-death family antitoxin [Bacteroidota bacterium]|nr:type II toxin-antitoxin system prevent-host-death family antitoxin [Bacteroidota bacterium]
MESTAKRLRFHTKELLEVVSRGEEVVITLRGKPYARLVPYSKKQSKQKNELFGIWKDNEKVANVEEFVRGLRKRRR